MLYELKYKKYKNKYLKLKNIQYGGGEAQLIIKATHQFTYILGVSEDVLKTIRDLSNDKYVKIECNSFKQETSEAILDIYFLLLDHLNIKYISGEKVEKVGNVSFPSIYISINTSLTTSTQKFYNIRIDNVTLDYIYEDWRIFMKHTFDRIKEQLESKSFEFELNEMSVRSPQLPIIIDDSKLKILNESELYFHHNVLSIGAIKSQLDNSSFIILTNKKDPTEQIYIRKNKENSNIEGLLERNAQIDDKTRLDQIRDFVKDYRNIKLSETDAYYNL